MNTITAPNQSSSTDHPVQVGHFVQEILVTDTRVFEVIKVTAKTITIRDTRPGEKLSNENMIVLTEALSDPNGTTRTLKLRKDGTFRTRNGSSNLTRAREFNGSPVRKVDLSF